MRIKRYFAPDMRQAIRQVRDEQGPDAVILSNRRVEGGVEIIAAIDYDEQAVVAAVAEAQAEPRREPQAARPAEVRPYEFPQAGAPAAARPAAAPRAASPARTEPTLPPVQRYAEMAAAAPPAHEAPRVVWSQEPAIVDMRRELASLRALLENQLGALAWGDYARRQPSRAKLMERLTSLGLAPALCQRVAGAVQPQAALEDAWREALGTLAGALRVTGDDILTQGGVVALVGPTGVGKTTTIAKLAARYALRHGPGRVGFVSTDNYRIGAHAQLRSYARILDAPVRVAGDAKALAQALTELNDKSLVLIDTAGMSQRDVRLSEQFAVLQEGAPRVKPYVVLSANTQRGSLEEVVTAFGRVPLAGAVVTKVDETNSLGGALSTLIEGQLPLAYVSDGQRVPEDLHAGRAHPFVSRAAAMLDRAEPLSEESLAMALGGMVSHANI